MRKCMMVCRKARSLRNPVGALFSSSSIAHLVWPFTALTSRAEVDLCQFGALSRSLVIILTNTLFLGSIVNFKCRSGTDNYCSRAGVAHNIGCKDVALRNLVIRLLQQCIPAATHPSSCYGSGHGDANALNKL